MKRKKRAFAKTEPLLQMELTECGAAALTMVLRYFGQQASLEEIRVETDVTRNGCNAGNLVRAARSRGLECDGYQKDPDQLRHMQPPCILWWEKNHFVVFEGIKGDSFYINDPAYGRRKLKKEDFARAYSGILLTFSPGPGFRSHPQYGRRPGRGTRLAGELAHLRGQGIWAVSAAAFLLLSGGLSLLLAFRIGVATDALRRAVLSSTPLSQPAPGGQLLLLLLLLLALAGSFMGGQWFLGKLRDRVEMETSHPFLQRLFRLPISFYQQRSPGDLIDRIRRHDRLSRCMTEDAVTAACNLALAFASAVLLWMQEPSVGLAAVLAVLGTAAVFQWQWMRSVHDRSLRSVLEVDVTEEIWSGLHRAETIHSMGLENDYVEKAADLLHRRATAEEAICRREWAGLILRGILYLAAAVWILRGSLTGILLYGLLLIWVESTAPRLARLQQADEDLQAAGDICRRRETESLKNRPVDRTAYRKLQGNLACEDASFGYERFGEPVLKGLHLQAESGSSLLITGPSGSGKSTAGKLLCGLIYPDSGRIRYDGRELSRISENVRHASITAVAQTPALFSGSIRDNITMWNPHVREEDVLRAAENAGIAEQILSREGGFDRIIGMDGEGLSGGERQRIEIARALAADPSVLVLDEAVSGLDEETSRRVMEGIRKRGATLVLISHKETWSEFCDQVVYLGEDGGHGEKDGGHGDGA